MGELHDIYIDNNLIKVHCVIFVLVRKCRFKYKYTVYINYPKAVTTSEILKNNLSKKTIASNEVDRDLQD